MSNTPTWGEVLRGAVENRLADVHVSLPGVIVSYDSTQQKASVQPLIRRSVIDAEGQRQVKQIPIINGVPVSFPGSGDFSMTWPVAVGDTGTLFFSEGSIDKWKTVGGEIDPNDDRRFHLSDAIFIPGLRPFNSPIPAAGVHSTAMVIRSGGAIHAGGTSSLALKSALDSVALRVRSLEIEVGTVPGANSYAGTTVLKGA